MEHVCLHYSPAHVGVFQKEQEYYGQMEILVSLTGALLNPVNDRTQTHLETGVKSNLTRQRKILFKL